MNITISKNEFLKYVKNYDKTSFQINRKISHSLRVMDLCTQIATSINLTEEEINLATLIGLLHDIARFEQFTKYKTFNDSKSFDHGAYGVKILKDNNFIRKFIKEDKYDNIIYTSIYNHNKFKIEDNIDDTTLLFCKIIRDADKLDILYQNTCITWQNSPEEIENIKITSKHLQPFIEKRPVNRLLDLNQEERPLNHFLIILGFIFDINFKESYKILKEKDYMNTIINRFDFKDSETKKNLKKIKNMVNEEISIQ